MDMVNDQKEMRNMKSDSLPLRRKVTYAFTDLAGNLLYCLIGSYALYYFTDVYGLSVSMAGTILLLARFIDALDAPVWGMIIDHTKSKQGKSRIWFLRMAIPFALSVWLLFTNFNLSGTAKIAYAAIMYIVAGISYTGVSTPITSVLPNLTSNTEDRTLANTFRMIGGNVGNFLAITFILPLVSFFGQGNDQKGWSMAVGLYAVIACVLILIAYFDMREKNIQHTVNISIKESFQAAKGNWPWVLVVVGNIMFWLGLTARNSSLIYFFQYNMGDKDLVSIFNGISIIQVVGMAMIPMLVKRLRKWGSTILGFVIASIGQLGVVLFTGNLPMMIVAWCIACIGSGIACSLFFEMVGDTVDFGEWKTGIRASGFLTAIGSSFCIKIGSGLGGFLPSMIMNAAGYQADKVQSQAALNAIQFSFCWLPLIIFVLAIIPMYLYKRYEKNEMNVRQDLAARHSKGA